MNYELIKRITKLWFDCPLRVSRDGKPQDRMLVTGDNGCVSSVSVVWERDLTWGGVVTLWTVTGSTLDAEWIE